MRHPSKTLTDAEQRIMDVLWKKQEATVREVAEVLTKSHPVAYTTVLTMLGVLEKKGFAGHRKAGRAHVYHPLVSRRDTRTKALRHMIQKFFDGSPEALAQHLMDESDIDIDELQALKREFEEEDGNV